MKEMLKYKSTIKARSFLYLEMKKASNLYLQGFSIDEIKQKALEENIFLLKTESRIKEIASTIEDRMRALDDFLISKIAQGNLETSKQITLYSILKTDRLFFEFMQEVYREKYLLMDYLITDKDFSIFFQRKAEQSHRIASWKDYTYYKLEQVYKRILLEAGFARKSKTNIEITRPIMEKDIIDYLKGKGDDIYIKAMLGEM
jgi:competence CoiA-like predicted nuclease